MVELRSLNILFYTPLNTRCRDIESQAIEFSKAGNRIFLLTQNELGGLHDNFKSYGFTVSADNSNSFSKKFLALKRLFYLISFCRKNDIDIVYSHLEPSNFIAVLAQYFIKSRVIICRHHVDAAKLYSFDNDFSYKLTYKLARDIIVVSKRAKEYMIMNEYVDAARIHVFPLSYYFDLYDRVNTEFVDKLRDKHKTQVLMLSVFRLTKYKRPQLSIITLSKLIEFGIDAKLIILGKGELDSELLKLVKEKNLENRVIFEGYVTNVLDYMKAADFLIHPSLLDSSSIVLKESAIVNLPMIACRDVGDFDEVIQDHKSGFLVDKDNFVKESVSILKQYYKEKESLEKIGKASEVIIRDRFSIKSTKLEYERLFHVTTRRRS